MDLKSKAKKKALDGILGMADEADHERLKKRKAPTITIAVSHGEGDEAAGVSDEDLARLRKLMESKKE